ncbi:helix-turn-helix transcriptional regulator [Streptomyces scopuliridis]|uniref:XRE family transcriptional regulator n=1 Tax=Streptomyces scopuliridis RB72 TaxID=1440053 RepID=A0A2T7T9E9_9ACTN|nr:helix-turn-helix transcriptional regulator [Streptomyces scopuliridis]PVE11800.1 XRE family transcriptional regulator [Streptomyces scopuliridis RB72]
MAREQRNVGGSGLGIFLRTRRAQVAPEDVGLVPGAGLRRTPGLRREELATLAGISIDYYARLERGQEANPSPSVVDALARALRLDAHDHDHLRELAVRAGRRAEPEPSASADRTVRPDIELMLERLRPNPAYVISPTMDILATNPGGLRLFAGMEERPPEERNALRYLFLDPHAPKLFADWDEQVRTCVGRMRVLAGTEPDTAGLAELIDGLLLESPEFARRWKHYDVQPHPGGDKSFHHPQVGDLTLGYQSMQLEGTPGHRLVVFYAEPGTPEHDKIVLLDATVTEPASKATGKKRS